MANTSQFNIIKDYVIAEMSKKLKVELKTKKIQIGISSNGTVREKKFDGVSKNCDIVIVVSNNSGYTSGGKKPTGKIRSVFASCYFLSLTKAKKKILILTDKEFYEIFKKESDGLLKEIELQYFSLPDDMEEIKSAITRKASEEMS